ncbi:glutamate--tRNA ligase [Membranihabitans marinus]|uniref:glutamate--tRNA ligase n=1 Tax=Membranihabitans marinus TaxID=1227546 RepID=UPI001EFF622E|nr:glutamate--tRNA ligase [Membranihabitans marinus]
MSHSKVRVRFAPSPTGALHIGGVRTALYNYLFAKKFGGDFILRIEDTDQTRFVEGAEKYIKDSLQWLGIEPVEGPDQGGPHGPYRQSERKSMYHTYAQQLLDAGLAYMAFDTPEELDALREDYEQNKKISFKYDASVRNRLNNSLHLSPVEVEALLEAKTPYVIRMMIPEDEEVFFNDLVRGHVRFDTNELDDKVILKADGMPTYHLANIVDDYHMQISHVIRGEEWLSSTAHHVLLYQMLGWEDSMPAFAHLPLLLKPKGSGKLSKRDGAKFGFPVFPMRWIEPDSQDEYQGFKENGFLPEAFLNFISLLGWNPGDDQEIMSMDTLIKAFDIEKISKSGARFDYNKALWFNQQYIIQSSNETLLDYFKLNFPSIYDMADPEYMAKVLELYRERIHTLIEFPESAKPFFSDDYFRDDQQIKKRYKEENDELYAGMFEKIIGTEPFLQANLKASVESYVEEKESKFGVILPILRLAIAGILQGPDMFAMMEVMGKEKVSTRLEASIPYFKSVKMRKDE